jgi:hypothetical protein
MKPGIFPDDEIIEGDGKLAHIEHPHPTSAIRRPEESVILFDKLFLTMRNSATVYIDNSLIFYHRYFPRTQSSMPRGGVNVVERLGMPICIRAPMLDLADDGFTGKVKPVTPHSLLKFPTTFSENHTSGKIDFPDLPLVGAGPSEYLHPFFLRPQRDQ